MAASSMPSASGIRTYLYLLFGLPHETDADRRRTVELLARNAEAVDFLDTRQQLPTVFGMLDVVRRTLQGRAPFLLHVLQVLLGRGAASVVMDDLVVDILGAAAEAAGPGKLAFLPILLLPPAFS